jgi:hypothetical protein
LQGWSKIRQRTLYAPNQQPVSDAASLIDRNQGIAVGVAPLSLTLVSHSKVFAFCSHLFILYRLTGLSSKSKTVSSDSIELEVKTATWAIWAPQASEFTGRKWRYGAVWGD